MERMEFEQSFWLGPEAARNVARVASAVNLTSCFLDPVSLYLSRPGWAFPGT